MVSTQYAEHSRMITSVYVLLLDQSSTDALLKLLQEYCRITSCVWSRGSSVSIVSGCGLDDRANVFRSPAGAKDFSSNLCPDRLWGPPSLLYSGYRGSENSGTQPHGMPQLGRLEKVFNSRIFNLSFSILRVRQPN
jgi:hypothetical protein